MSIDLSNYYTYLNNISSSLTENINSVNKTNYNISDTENTSSDFEMAFLSMLNQSKAAYEKISEKEEAGELSTSSTGTADDLYDSLTQIMGSYESMKAQSSIPKSIQESLLETLNNSTTSTDSDSDSITSDYQSNLDIDSLVKKALSQL